MPGSAGGHEGRTLEEVTANLKEAIDLHLEDEDLDALRPAGDASIVALMELDRAA